MSEFRFAEPQWVHAFWGLLAFAGLLLWLERRGGSAVDRLLARSLQGRLVQRPSPWGRRLRLLLFTLAGACLIVALMRPQWGLRHVATPRLGAEIMVCLDVSRSMLAEDVAPSRLERAKAEIADLLGYLDGDQVGLIAFAGRATVLSPLTPDFSFLRLVLDGAGPHSVARGGTRLEEPIRKAVAGFGPAGEASRAILLVTDGEDHQSFPLDAAKAAAEQGIRIIAIGFGDEAGSEVYVTDPRTGARTLLRDANGAPVRSRLDGDLLRELALATGGAYVPAGTGVLNLESIYDQHIARLTRGRLDPRGRTVRDEGYQWAVLLGLVFLVSSVVVSARSGARAAAAVLLVLVLAPTPEARGGEDAPSADATEAAEAGAPAESAARAPESDAARPPEPEDPREMYNRGVAALEAEELDDARRWFDRSRREARADGDLRVNATYNLGWTAARRADSLEPDAPADALQALYEAADWFREAVQLRPEDADARHNLDVTLRRALVLADRLAREGDGGIEARLEEIAGRQRDLAAELAGLLEQTAAEPDRIGTDGFRREFRARAGTQRTLLSDADALAAQVGDERDAIEARPDEERTPEDRMRGAQLANVLHYLHRARERMGQTRSQLRQRQGERAYRRASAALVELKRALDQLRDPVAVLDIILRDAAEVRTATALLAASRREIPGLEQIELPPWLTRESAQESQAAVAERTGELHLRLLAGLEQSGEAADEALLASVREAEPFVNEGRAHLQRAAEALAGDELDDALSAQHEGMLALGEARERFLDLRGLVEAAHAEEKRIAAILDLEGEGAEAARDEYLPSLRAAQGRNLARGERLDGKIASEFGRLAATAPGAAGTPPPEAEDDAGAERQRLELASQLLVLAMAKMEAVLRVLGQAEGAPARVDWAAARAAAAGAVEHLEALRRVFFSIAEQVRELARDQIDVADRTQDAVALAGAGSADAGARAGPLVPQQEELAGRAGEIASALEEQSNQAGGVVADQEEAVLETNRRLREAGEHVLLAQIEMEGAAAGIAADPPELAAARTRQDAALSELEQALALLAPPEATEGDEGRDPQGQGESRQTAQSMDPARLLQAVRDREAQRRSERAKRERKGYETVEKDW